MNLCKKLLKMIIVICGCAVLFSFGGLPQKMITDMEQALRYLKVPAERVKIQEMSQEGMKKGHAGYIQFSFTNKIIVNLDKNMFSNYVDPVKQLLINHTLLREAVRVLYRSRVWKRCGQDFKDRRYYLRENSDYQRCLSLVKKLEKLLKESFIFPLVFAASLQLVDKVGIKRKILGCLLLVSVVNVYKNLFNSYKNNKKFSIYKNAKNFYAKMLKLMVCGEGGNIIDNFGAREAKFDCSREFLKEAEKMYANFPNEDESIFRINLKTSPKYNRGKCIQMRDDFLVNVGTLAVMFHRDRENYNKYIEYLEDDIKVKINLHGIFPSVSVEQRLYASAFTKNTDSEKGVIANLEYARENKGPYAKIVDGYLREKILGLFEKDLQVYQGDIKGYMRVRKKDLLVYQGDMKEYSRARNQGKRPMHSKLKEPAWWDEILGEKASGEKE